MVHCLARAAALEAARAKTHARATLLATSHAFGVKDAHLNFNAFLREMQSIIAAASPPRDTGLPGVTQEELDTFDAIAARAERPPPDSCLLPPDS